MDMGHSHGHGKYEWWSKYGFICGIILLSYIFDKFSSNILGIKVNGPEILKWAVQKDESVRSYRMEVDGPHIQKWDKGLGIRIGVRDKG